MLKTLGVSPRQILVAFLCEGVIFGAIGSAAGIVFGNALAFAILRTISRTVNALYVVSRPESITLTPAIIAAGALVGMLLSLVSAIQPSIEAAGVRPSLLIQPGLQQRVGVVSRRAFATLRRLLHLRGGDHDARRSTESPVGGCAAVLLVVIAFSLLSPMILTFAAILARPLRAMPNDRTAAMRRCRPRAAPRPQLPHWPWRPG